MTPFGIAVSVLAIFIQGLVLVCIILLLIEGTLYIWDWKGARALARYQANKRIK